MLGESLKILSGLKQALFYQQGLSDNTTWKPYRESTHTYMSVLCTTAHKPSARTERNSARVPAVWMPFKAAHTPAGG